MTSQQTETILSSERLYEGKVINLRRDTVQLPNGKTGKREVVEHQGAVAIVPLLENGDVVLVRQWRTAAGKALLEIPAGTRDKDGETLEACARRELVEEVHFAAGTMRALFAVFVAPGYSTEVIHVFLAEGLTPQDGKTDEDEFLDIVTLPLSEAIAKIETGEIADAKSVSGLLFVERMRR